LGPQGDGTHGFKNGGGGGAGSWVGAIT